MRTSSADGIAAELQYERVPFVSEQITGKCIVFELLGYQCKYFKLFGITSDDTLVCFYFSILNPWKKVSLWYDFDAKKKKIKVIHLTYCYKSKRVRCARPGAFISMM